jgi:DNA (cytosine-5)-methyltransferase 1
MRKNQTDFMKKITYIDLFAGAGGLSEGFTSAGFVPIAHVEMNSDACQTLMTRACFYFLKRNGQIDKYYDYLKGNITRNELYDLVPQYVIKSVICETMRNETMNSIYKRINYLMSMMGISHVDLVIGGPPCQAYSQVGRSRKCMDNDPRNELYKLYFQVLAYYCPSMFVFENVPGLLTAGGGRYLADILKKFESLGYTLDFKVIDASDYGVLQKRRRIILIGWRRLSKHFYPEFEKFEGSFKVNDILRDLPDVQPGGSLNKYKYEEISEYLKKTGIRTHKDILTWHVARNHSDRDRKIYKLVIEAWNTSQKRLKYSELPPDLTTHRNKNGFLDRYKVVASNLPASHTMMAHISKDGHYYIHPDIRQARSITVREAARIQSFPDNFYFEGSRTAAFIQIGNAVPPLMAKAIAIALRKQFFKSCNYDKQFS